MKIIELGDVHLRVRPPEGRTESDFFPMQIGKLEQVLSLAKDELCSAILQTGDFWDRPDPPKKAIAECIDLLNKYSIPIYAIAGQHDMVGHSYSSIDNSALRVMEAAHVVTILKEEPIQLDGIFIYGASFGQDVPKPSITERNILVIHDMIGDKLLYPNQKLTHPNSFLRKHLYELIVAGDYHYKFVQSYNGRYIVNPGCMTRLKRNERDLALEPAILIYDTETRELEEVLLNVNPVNKAFKVKEAKEDIQIQGIEELVEKLRSQGKLGVDFANNLQEYYKENKTDKPIRERISKVIESIKELRK